MKNGLLTILILLFVLPVLTPWLPHGFMHDFHHSQVKHHANNSHDHGHNIQAQTSETAHDDHSAFHIDVVTYFNDYLHVDLPNAQQTYLSAPDLDIQDVDYTVPAVTDFNSPFDIAVYYSRAPPDQFRPFTDKTPLYLSTQRIRI